MPRLSLERIIYGVQLLYLFVAISLVILGLAIYVEYKGKISYLLRQEASVGPPKTDIWDSECRPSEGVSKRLGGPPDGTEWDSFPNLVPKGAQVAVDATITAAVRTGGPNHNLYALLIGIDDYHSLARLCGAVADADAMSEFLGSDLGIPTDHIVNLRNEQATRSRIIQEFQTLGNNPLIQRGDPILIYFAGHGGLKNASKKWVDRYGAQQIQVIFPVDYEQEVLGPEGAGPQKFNCIPDKTIAKLLNKLAVEKGDNIVVIFDSCHSASGTRDATLESVQESNRNRRHRSAEVVLDIPHDIDDDLFDPEDIQTPFPEKRARDAQLLLHTDQSSHVHFAACGIHQTAVEEFGRGIFTAALLKKMRGIPVENVTYHDLLKGISTMDLGNQSPQCYGKHKNRILFDARVSSRTIPFTPAYIDSDAWILEAGAASGVNLGSEWKLHISPVQNSESVGQLKVTELYGSVAVLELLDSGDKQLTATKDHPMYALCTHIGGGDELVLKVWISLRDRMLLFGDDNFAGSTDTGGIGYITTSTRGEADVALEVCPADSMQSNGATGVTQSSVIFYLCDHLAEKYGTHKLQQRTPVRKEEVNNVLFAAARWRWHLQRRNSDSSLPKQTVSMSMLKVAVRPRQRFKATRLQRPEPVHPIPSTHSDSTQASPSPSTFTVSNRIMVDNTVEFTIDSSLYGFKLTCTREVVAPLYVKMFYFNASDLSISDMFGNNTAIGEDTPNLFSGGELLIGGSGDSGSPIQFSLSPGQEVELGYMKVFWSTQPMELDYIEQTSPFSLRRERGASKVRDVTTEEWGIACLALISRKPTPAGS